MAEPKLRTTPEQRARWSRFDGWPGWLCGDIKTLLARVRELEEQLATGFEAFQAKCEELRNSVPRSRYDIANQQYNELQAKLDRVTAKARAEIEWLLAEREGAAVVKLEHLEKIRWQRVAIGAKRNGSLVYVTRCLGCGCSKSTEDGPDCWIAAAIRAAGGER